MSMARELIAAVMVAEKNIDEQISKLSAYKSQNEDIIRDIIVALDGSSHESAWNMQQRLSQTQAEIVRTLQMLQDAKSKLIVVRRI